MYFFPPVSEGPKREKKEKESKEIHSTQQTSLCVDKDLRKSSDEEILKI